MSKTHECTNCGTLIRLEPRHYRDTESGLSNLILQGLPVADCPNCGNTDMMFPKLGKIHRAIAQALASSPVRLSGEQLRFLRTYLGLSGNQLAAYLHTDKTKISKWERGGDRIGPTTDRLIRLLVAALDPELRPSVFAVAEHLPLISDDPKKQWELHIDVATLLPSFVAVSKKKAA